MKRSIQIIEKSTGVVHTEITTLEQLIKFLEGDAFREDFQRRNALEKLLLSNKSSALSLDFLWEAKFFVKKKKKSN